MGAINYGTSELFCNLGYNLNNDVDNYEEERVKELHKIGRALIHLTNYFGLVNYTPGWSTGYATTGDTIKMIKKAVKKEIMKIYNTPKTAKIYA